MSRIKQLERLDRLEIEEEDLATLNIKFPPARSGQIVAEINEAGMSFGEKHVFSGANLRHREEATKSRWWAATAAGQRPRADADRSVDAHRGRSGWGPASISAMRPESGRPDGRRSRSTTLDRVAVGDIRTRLRLRHSGAFLFRGETSTKSRSSGGERARLAMARMMLEPRNLVLDEPTNHMDMRSKDILKNAIMKYDGARSVVVARPRIPRRHGAEGLRVPATASEGDIWAASTISSKTQAGVVAGGRAARRSVKTPAKGDEPKPAVSRKLLLRAEEGAGEAVAQSEKGRGRRSKELADIEKRIAEYDAKFAAAAEYDEAGCLQTYNELKNRYEHQMHEWEKASYRWNSSKNNTMDNLISGFVRGRGDRGRKADRETLHPQGAEGQLMQELKTSASVTGAFPGGAGREAQPPDARQPPGVVADRGHRIRRTGRHSGAGSRRRNAAHRPVRRGDRRAEFRGHRPFVLFMF